MITKDKYNFLLDSFACLYAMSNEFDLSGLDDDTYNKLVKALDDCRYIIEDNCPLMPENNYTDLPF